MEDFPLHKIKARLDEITAEMTTLIRQYGLTADSPFQVIEAARKSIPDQAEYIRFLELSLEGRILGEIADAMAKAEEEQAGNDNPGGGRGQIH